MCDFQGVPLETIHQAKRAACVIAGGVRRQRPRMSFVRAIVVFDVVAGLSLSLSLSLSLCLSLGVCVRARVCM
jgi:hypothetical protein